MKTRRSRKVSTNRQRKTRSWTNSQLVKAPSSSILGLNGNNSIQAIIQRVIISPQSLTRNNVMQLHSLICNNAVGQILRSAAPNSLLGLSTKQAKFRSNKTDMPVNLKKGLENISGMSMDHVKVHYNSPKPEQLHAHAYTQGSDIHLAPGQEKHLPHEGWHVVQQAHSNVKPTMQMAGTQINDDSELEKEADAMGKKALSVGQRGKTFDSNKIPSYDFVNSFGRPSISSPKNQSKSFKNLKLRAMNQKNFYSGNMKVVQRKIYDGDVRINTEVDAADLNNWGTVRNKLRHTTGTPVTKGGSANSSIASDVNTSLTDLALSNVDTCMSAHMIPNRIGGAGNITNVRPWKKSFERGTWENKVETVFNTSLKNKPVGTVIPYHVETDDMTIDEAKDIVKRSTIAVEKVKTVHAPRIQQIPKHVSATIGENHLSWTDEPIRDLIKTQGMPYVRLEHPLDRETMGNDYSIKMVGNSDTNNVKVKIQQVGTDGDWVQTRQTPDGSWWYDWKNINPGDYEVVAQAWNSAGKSVESKVIRVKKT